MYVLVYVLSIGVFGIRSAAPIVLPPHGCALALGSIIDRVVPAKEEECGWKV